jgi:hypothetical protein
MLGIFFRGNRALELPAARIHAHLRAGSRLIGGRLYRVDRIVPEIQRRMSALKSGVQLAEFRFARVPRNVGLVDEPGA